MKSKRGEANEGINNKACFRTRSERTAQRFMAVAQTFGPITEIIATLTIQPTAAYLLEAPSAPNEARQTAIERAEAGEQITTAVAGDGETVSGSAFDSGLLR